MKSLLYSCAALPFLFCGGLLQAQPLVVVDVQASTLREVPVTIPVLGSDSDAATNQMAVLQVTQPSDGQVTINSGAAVSNPDLSRLFQFAAVQLSNTVAQVADTNLYPWLTLPDGTWETIPSSDNDWISGFFPGLLWLIYEHTGDTNYLGWAEDWMAGIAPEEFSTNTDDVGFMVNTSFGNAWRLTGNPEFEAVLLQTAQSLSMRFNPVVGCLADDQMLAPPPFEVIIDTMMNSLLLYSAYDLAGNTNFYNIAFSHAGRAFTNQIRADGSTFQQVIYDADTGAVISQGNRVGIPSQDTWARGHSWAIYGFTMAYAQTGDTRFLDAAQETADFYIANAPTDYVPVLVLSGPHHPQCVERFLRRGGDALRSDPIEPTGPQSVRRGNVLAGRAKSFRFTQFNQLPGAGRRRQRHPLARRPGGYPGGCFSHLRRLLLRRGARNATTTSTARPV